MKDTLISVNTGGEFELYQTTTGQLAEFNLWKSEMSADELNTLTCEAEGNVASWGSLQEHGTSLRTSRTFANCDGK